MAANEVLFGFNLQQKKSLINFLQAAGVLAADGATSNVAALEDDVASIAAWGTALATKLNADAGVTDTNYDTTPLA